MNKLTDPAVADLLEESLDGAVNVGDLEIDVVFLVGIIPTLIIKCFLVLKHELSPVGRKQTVFVFHQFSVPAQPPRSAFCRRWAFHHPRRDQQTDWFLLNFSLFCFLLFITCFCVLYLSNYLW